MESLRLRCEVVTPLFCSGADQAEAEFRPPSVRGLVRYWFRALLGGVVGHDLPTLRALESKVFGDTRRASTASFRTRPEHVETKQRGDRIDSVRSGLMYVGYPFYKWQRQERTHTLARGMLAPGSTWSLEVLLPRSKGNVRDVVTGALWTAFLFGGLGSRSRRGFGTIRVETASGASALQWRWPRQPEAFVDWVRKNLQAVDGALCAFVRDQGITPERHLLDVATSTTSAFASFSRWRAVAFTHTTWRSWEPVLHDVGTFMRQFREVPRSGARQPHWKPTVTQDYRAVVSRFLDGELNSGEAVDLKHDAFGLPIQYRSPGRQGALAILEWEEGDRRGSPLFVHPVKFDDNRYGLLCLLMASQFLPAEARAKLQVSDRNWPSSRPKPDPVPVEPASFDILHAFLNALGHQYTQLGELP